MAKLTFDDVTTVRGWMVRARELAAARFREAFASGDATVPPEERWGIHLQIQAAAMLECFEDVGLPEGCRIEYIFQGSDGRDVQPIVVSSDAPAMAGTVRLGSSISGTRLFRWFRIERTDRALLAYWFLTSELSATAAWATTSLIANAEEYSAALGRMKSVEIVRALNVSWLPVADWRADGTGTLEVTVYTRGGEERIERRVLICDRDQELTFHGSQTIARGGGGINA